MLVIVVERWRLRGYQCFWIMIVVGVLLTKAFSGIDEGDTVLQEVFGYNSICLYFDFPPSNYILPLFWAITASCMLVNAGGSILRAQSYWAKGHIDEFWCKTLGRIKLFEISGLIAFSMVFAVSPERWDHTLVIHTLPFLYLQLVLVSLSVSTTIEGLKSGYFRRLELPPWFDSLQTGHCILLLSVVVVKVPWAIITMARGKPTGSIALARFFDFLFLFCAVVYPLIKTAYLVKFKSDKLEVVRLTPDMLPGREASHWTAPPKPSPCFIKQIEQAPTSDLGVCTAFAGLILFIIFWNVMKLPFYLPLGFELPMTDANYDSGRCQGKDPPLVCDGLMTSYPLSAAFGFHGEKLLADPQLFFGPHTIMGCTLLGMIFSVIRGWKSMHTVSYVFLPLSFIFAIHVLPISHGIPSSVFGWNVNALVCSIVICGSLAGGVALLISSRYPAWSHDILLVSWIAIVSMVFAAPALEWRGIIGTLGKRARNQGRWVIEHPNRPHEESGRDFYGSCGCSWLGWMMSGLLLVSVVPCCWFCCESYRSKPFPVRDCPEGVEVKEVIGRADDSQGWKVKEDQAQATESPPAAPLEAAAQRSVRDEPAATASWTEPATEQASEMSDELEELPRGLERTPSEEWC